MKRILLVLLAAFILQQAPWRLMVLLAEVPFVSRTATRMVDTNTRYWDALDLEQQLRAHGWTVEYTDLEDGTSGMTSVRSREIVIDQHLAWDARFAILAHEAGHTEQPSWATHNQGEAYAEMVAALLAHNGYREHARYLARMRADTYLLALTEWRAIYRTAEAMESR